MGYHITQLRESFRIRESSLDSALQAIKGLAGKETIRDGPPHRPHFHWVKTSRFLQAETLTEAMRAWRWDLDMEPGEGAIGINLRGEWTPETHRTKLGDELILFQAIAPYVKLGSFIEVQGEDSTILRWIFDGESCHQTAIHPCPRCNGTGARISQSTRELESCSRCHEIGYIPGYGGSW